MQWPMILVHDCCDDCACCMLWLYDGSFYSKDFLAFNPHILFRNRNIISDKRTTHVNYHNFLFFVLSSPFFVCCSHFRISFLFLCIHSVKLGTLFCVVDFKKKSQMLISCIAWDIINVSGKCRLLLAGFFFLIIRVLCIQIPHLLFFPGFTAVPEQSLSI